MRALEVAAVNALNDALDELREFAMSFPRRDDGPGERESLMAWATIIYEIFSGNNFKDFQEVLRAS